MKYSLLIIILILAGCAYLKAGDSRENSNLFNSYQRGYEDSLKDKEEQKKEYYRTRPFWWLHEKNPNDYEQGYYNGHHSDEDRRSPFESF